MKFNQLSHENELHSQKALKTLRTKYCSLLLSKFF